MPRRFHARVLARRRTARHDVFLSDADFRFAADCERMRVDRNGSVLSLLLIRLPAKHSSDSDIGLLARVLEGRLRVTDTPGLLNDGRIAVLLPDTPAEGAWKVAADVSEVYPPGPERPECDVLVYLPHQRPGGGLEGVGLEASGGASSGELLAAPDPPQPSEFFFAKPIATWKRGVDVVGAVLGLVISAPIIALAAAAIKLDTPGPAFFVQEREGLGGRRFKMYKLRTMYVDAETLKPSLLPHSVQDGPAFKMYRDPRTTPFGRFLRWSSIDELPQLWNVLRGEMSLVGPRPLPTYESQACQPWQRRRLTVTPGITCTWQVSARGKARFDDWVRMDLRYAAKISPWEDLKLLLITLPSLVFHKGIR